MVAGQANKNRGNCDTIEVKVGRGIYFIQAMRTSLPLYGGLELSGGYLETRITRVM